MPWEPKPFQQEENRMAYPTPNPAVEPFLTLGLRVWMALFCVVHLLGLAILVGIDAQPWAYQGTRMNSGLLLLGEIPALTCEPGFVLAYFLSPSNSKAAAILGMVSIILLADAAVWLLPVFGVRWFLWSSRRRWNGGATHSR